MSQVEPIGVLPDSDIKLTLAWRGKDESSKGSTVSRLLLPNVHLKVASFSANTFFFSSMAACMYAKCSNAKKGHQYSQWLQNVAAERNVADALQSLPGYSNISTQHHALNWPQWLPV